MQQSGGESNPEPVPVPGTLIGRPRPISFAVLPMIISYRVSRARIFCGDRKAMISYTAAKVRIFCLAVPVQTASKAAMIRLLAEKVRTV